MAVCIDYPKLNKVTRKDHFPLPFIDPMIYKLPEHAFYCFLDGYSGYNLSRPDSRSDPIGGSEPGSEVRDRIGTLYLIFFF